MNSRVDPTIVSLLSQAPRIPRIVCSPVARPAVSVTQAADVGPDSELHSSSSAWPRVGAGTKQQAVAGSVSASPDLPSTVLSWSPAFIQITSPGPPHLYTNIVRGANFSLLGLEIR